MKTSDLIAIVLSALCMILLGCGYFLSSASETFRNIISYLQIIIMGLTIVYLFFTYKYKK